MAVTLAVAITQNSQSVAKNQSNVTVKVTASWTGGSFNQTQKSGTCTINGVQYSFTSSFNENRTTSGSKVLYTKTLDIAHNSDGTKTLNASASYVTGVSSGTITASASKTLTTIPRASSVAVSPSSVDIGSNVTISITRASSNFTHTLKYTFAGTTGTIATGVATSKTWEVPIDLVNSITNSTSGTMTITCETYSGTTKIGSKTTGIQVKVPTWIKPVIMELSAYDTQKYEAIYGAYVVDKSVCVISVGAIGHSGSDIVNCIINDAIYTSTTAMVQLHEGTNTFICYAVDTRGRKSDRATITINAIAYKPPTIETFTVERCNANGTLNPEGAYMKATIKATIDALNNKNSSDMQLFCRTTGSSTWQSWKSNSTYSWDGTEIIAANVDTEFEAMLKLQDDFCEDFSNSAVVSVVQIGSAFTLVDYHSSGKGLAFGKVASTENLFECNLPTQFLKGFTGTFGNVDMWETHTGNKTGVSITVTNCTNRGISGLIFTKCAVHGINIQTDSSGDISKKTIIALVGSEVTLINQTDSKTINISFSSNNGFQVWLFCSNGNGKNGLVSVSFS